MNNFIPVELKMANFGSHKKSRILFGNEDESIFISGISGSGKSHILDAIQYVFGKPIDSDDEFFNHRDVLIGGEKETVYEDQAIIEFTVINSGPNSLKFPFLTNSSEKYPTFSINP